MRKLTRRNFLGRSAAAAASAASPGVVWSQSIGGEFADYKALVCVFLRGGNDSFNLLVPRSEAEHDVYADARQNLAIAREDLLPIVPSVSGEHQYGLHPSAPGFRDLFQAGAASFVTNVGPLIEPTTKQQILDGTATLPLQLFSHKDQQAQWQSLQGRSRLDTGWAGRIADLIRTGVAGQQMATNASLAGANLFQSADETVPYAMGPEGPEQFVGLSIDPGDFPPEQRAAFMRIIEAEYGSIYERGFAGVQRRAIEAADHIRIAIDSAPPISAVFPDGNLGTQLRTVARLIAVRDQLQMKRQVFFVAAGGFDTHDRQNEEQPGLIGGVSVAMKAFYDATVELGISDSVTTFTQSDFGRTLTSNGDGTDHGWGGNQVVVGDAVQGRRLFGSYPLLQIDGPEDVGGGRMIPSTSADQYAATLAKWFGIPDAELDIVAPNIDRFAVRDLGFVIQ